jgi:hypothetical protein
MSILWIPQLFVYLCQELIHDFLYEVRQGHLKARKYNKNK